MNVTMRRLGSKGRSTLGDAEERARRLAAVDYAYGSVRLEGLQPDRHVRELNRRYVAGELTRIELTAAILAHCKS